MQAKRVEVRGGAFQTEVYEAGSGQPLVYLHGVRTVQAGDPLLARLAERYHVIAPVHPGFGESMGSEQLLDLWDLLYYYLDFLDEQGLRDLPLIGQNLGGMFAAELAALQPERFRKLVLITPFGLWNPDYPVVDFFTLSPPQLAELSYHDPKSTPAQAAASTPTEQEAYIAFMLDRAKALATTAKYVWPIPNRGLRKRLHRVRVPALVVWGESDRIAPPQYAEDFRRLLPQAQVAIIPEAGHMPQDEQPDRTARVILDFLGQA